MPIGLLFLCAFDPASGLFAGCALVRHTSEENVTSVPEFSDWMSTTEFGDVEIDDAVAG